MEELRPLVIGVALTRGQLVALLDADDICHPNRIAIQVDYLQKKPRYYYFAAPISQLLIATVMYPIPILAIIMGSFVLTAEGIEQLYMRKSDFWIPVKTLDYK